MSQQPQPSSSTTLLRGLVLEHMEGTLDSGLSRDNPEHFDLLMEVSTEALCALDLLARVDTLNLSWVEIRAVRNLVLFHEGCNVPENLVSLEVLNTLFTKMGQDYLKSL